MRLSLPSLLLLFSLSSANAADINWNSSIGANNYTSAGAPNEIGTGFVLELGSFGSGFTPTAANVDQWANFWVSLDRTDYNPTTKFFASKASLNSNAQPFHPSTRPYIWGFDGNSPGEWILVTNSSWFWPYAGGGPQPPVGMSITASGTTAVVGQINGNGFQMMTAMVSEDPPDVSPDAWLQQFFNAAERNDPEISGWEADPDCDGANNLYEFAAGTDPTSPASMPSPEVMLVDVGGGVREIQLRLPRSHRAAITYGAECAEDLESWNTSDVEIRSDLLDEVTFGFPAGEHRHFVRFLFSL